jgi:predicted acyltransferase
MSTAPTAAATLPEVGANAPVDIQLAISPTERLLSVDALRGFDMFWIIGADKLVESLGAPEDPGPVGFLVRQLTHVEWAGLRFYDLIFPLFVFLVGVAVVFSLEKQLQTEGKAGAYKRVFKRFLLLYLVALLYSGGISKGFDQIRWVGVLHRIAISYLCVSLLYLNFRLRGLLIACAALLIGYWAFFTFIPVPAEPALTAINPAWGHGGISVDPGNNWGNYIDFHYLPGRRFDTYWDPEGIVSSFPPVATALLGVFAGLLLTHKRLSNEKKVLYLLAAGLAGVALGYAWGLQFPLIKKLWTSSYVLVAAGYASILLGVFFYVIDVRGYRRWATPFVWIGSNALTLYLADRFFEFEKLSVLVLGGPVQAALEPWGELVVTLGALLLSILFARWLFKRRIFLRL